MLARWPVSSRERLYSAGPVWQVGPICAASAGEIRLANYRVRWAESRTRSERVRIGTMDELIQALNRLLEAERAGVEALVDLTRMSADLVDREMLQRIG